MVLTAAATLLQPMNAVNCTPWACCTEHAVSGCGQRDLTEASIAACIAAALASDVPRYDDTNRLLSMHQGTRNMLWGQCQQPSEGVCCILPTGAQQVHLPPMQAPRTTRPAAGPMVATPGPTNNVHLLPVTPGIYIPIYNHSLWITILIESLLLAASC